MFEVRCLRFGKECSDSAILTCKLKTEPLRLLTFKLLNLELFLHVETFKA